VTKNIDIKYKFWYIINGQILTLVDSTKELNEINIAYNEKSLKKHKLKEI